MTEISPSPAAAWRTRIRTDLLAARKARDTVRVAALRSALAAIDNAETPDLTLHIADDSGVIAGATTGLGAAEVARRELSGAQIRDLMGVEIAERLHAAHTIDAHDRERADTLHAEAAIVRDLLDTVEII